MRRCAPIAHFKINVDLLILCTILLSRKRTVPRKRPKGKATGLFPFGNPLLVRRAHDAHSGAGRVIEQPCL